MKNKETGDNPSDLSNVVGRLEEAVMLLEKSNKVLQESDRAMNQQQIGTNISFLLIQKMQELSAFHWRMYVSISTEKDYTGSRLIDGKYHENMAEGYDKKIKSLIDLYLQGLPLQE